MNQRAAEPSRSEGDHRSPFDRFVESAYQHVSRAPFFAVVLVVVVVWFASVPLWSDLKAWQVAIHTVGTVVSLLLIVLLENAGRRSEEAAQEKLNVLADGLAALMASVGRDDPDLQDAHRRLTEAVRPEERH